MKSGLHSMKGPFGPKKKISGLFKILLISFSVVFLWIVGRLLDLALSLILYLLSFAF